MVSQDTGLSVPGPKQTRMVGHTVWPSFLGHEEMGKGHRIFGVLLTSGGHCLKGRAGSGCSLLVLTGSGSDDGQLPAGGQACGEQSISPVSKQAPILSLRVTWNTHPPPPLPIQITLIVQDGLQREITASSS